MWELDCEEGWAPKYWCFWIVVLEKTLESSLDCKEIQTVHPKGNQSWIFIGRTDTEAETPIVWSLMRRTGSFEKTLMLGKIEGSRRRWRQRMKWLDDITDLMDMIFSKLLEWWWTGMPGLLQSMGHYESDSLSDWTELNWLLNSKACCEDCFPQEWLHWDKNLTCSQLTHCPGMKHSNWQC